MTNADNFADLVGSDNRVLPLQELEMEIAAHVGAATLQAGELDAVMGALAVVAGPPDLCTIGATWGESGTVLTKALLKMAASAGVAPDDLEELDRLCARYDTLYEIRNDLIHSFRPGNGSERLDVVRAARIKKAKPLTDTNGMTQQRRLGLSELVDLYYDLDDLIHDARGFYFRAIGLID